VCICPLTCTVHEFDVMHCANAPKKSSMQPKTDKNTRSRKPCTKRSICIHAIYTHVAIGPTTHNTHCVAVNERDLAGTCKHACGDFIQQTVLGVHMPIDLIAESFTMSESVDAIDHIANIRIWNCVCGCGLRCICAFRAGHAVHTHHKGVGTRMCA
jgi:hypothetical protein